jgi:DNA-directed RNA polymerase specialized sigma24 family protein
MGTNRIKHTGCIGAAGYARLLARLDPDPDRAAAEYERLRVTLEKFFDWQGAWPPEECADETLDRLALKLEAGTSIDNVNAYARGIARLVLLEWQRRPTPVAVGYRLERAGLSVPPTPDDEADPLLGCFERCLATLDVTTRELILDYYVGDLGAKIDNRRRLAQTLGLSAGALRNRVQRVRNRLEDCVRTCTARAAEIGLEAATRTPVDLRTHDED